MKSVLKLTLFLAMSQLVLSSTVVAAKLGAVAQTVDRMQAPRTSKNTLTFSSYSGGSNTGGGGTVVADFYNTSLQVAANLDQLDEKVLKKFNVDKRKLKNKISQLKVKASAVPLMWDGGEVDAVNFPDEVGVLVYSRAWEKKTRVEKDELAIHEILGLLEAPDVQFKASKSLANLLVGFKTCKKIYLNMDPRDTEYDDYKYALAAAKELLRQYGEVDMHLYQVEIIYSYIRYSDIDEQNNMALNRVPKGIQKNSIIIDLNGETDFTGSEVRVTLFQSDSNGQVFFRGSKMGDTGFFSFKSKKDALIELGSAAIDLSCGNENYL